MVGFMKKLSSKLVVIASFIMMYLLSFPVVAGAEPIQPVLPQESNGYDSNLLTGLGIAIILPAIICLLIAYFSDKKSANGGKSILGLIGVSIILLIPLVSLIMLFVWAFGEKTKSDPTFRNYARLTLLGYLYFILFFAVYIGAAVLFQI